MEEPDLLNELIERIRNTEKRNDTLRKDIENKKNEIKLLENPKSEEESNKIEDKTKKNPKIPTDADDKDLGERFLHQLKSIKFNSFEIENNIAEYTIEYITQEHHNTLYIMGDFTKWELVPMKKNKDFFSYKIVLLKGFKYYYSFQSGDQIYIDYNNVYEENPKTLQIQNYIDSVKDNKPSQPFDFENDINILKSAQENYFFSKLNIEDNDEILFLEKFKRHITSGKEIAKKKREEYDSLLKSVYSFYDSQFNFIKPYEGENKFNNLKCYFKNRILAHYYIESKDVQYKYFFKIINISENFNFECIKLYDNNNIKINARYYLDEFRYYTISFEQISTNSIEPNSKLYHILPIEESLKILNDYNNDKVNILKAYFKTLTNLKNNFEQNNTQININPPNVQNEVNNLIGFRAYARSYGSILVTPNRVEPSRIKATDYEFHYSFNRIIRVKNKKEGSFIQFEAIDEAMEKAKKPFRFRIYYSIKNAKVNIIHCHVLDKDLRSIKMVIKEIDNKTDPHTLKKDEQYIKNNELLLIVLDSIPLKLYYKGKKVKFEAIKIEENKVYLLESPNSDSIFNKMYVTVSKIGDKINYDLIEQCNEFSYSLGEIQNGVDVQVTFDNNKNYVVEPMMLAVSPCLLKKLSSYEENLLNKNRYKDLKDIKNLNEMDTYFLITQKMNDYRKYNNKENVDKLEQKDKDNVLANLNEFKNSMIKVLNYIEQSEMWETLEEAANLAAEIEDIIKLFTKV